MNDKEKILRQKRYGQYFSGKKVADLLVSLLPDGVSIHNAIDPMAGTGDLLSSLKAKKPEAARLAGIEIDPQIIDTCRRELPDAEILQGDAFSVCMPDAPAGWDLVITNPPYIRYQLLNESHGPGALPSAGEVRAGLIAAIQKNGSLNPSDQKLFLDLARRYSGLSDLAVPAWILCASMVKQGGLLAMVVPDTWLNREYAIPIQYLLLRCFDVLSIVSDAGAAWFDSAQIRTSLVVAKRKATVSPEEALDAQTYCIKLGKRLADKDSLVGRLRYRDAAGFSAFSQILKERPVLSKDNYRAYTVKTYTLFSQLLTNGKPFNEKMDLENIHRLPAELKEALPSSGFLSFESLADMGWNIGQGLRTGANDFFYGNLIAQNPTTSVIRTNWYPFDVTVDNRSLIPVLQNRREICGFHVSASQLKKRLIYITDQIRESDAAALSAAVDSSFSVMRAETADYVSAGETYVPASGKSTKPFSERSAVKPNAHKDETGYQRFWYMLPKLAPRHLPCLCIPRICGKAAECLLVEQNRCAPIAVDANFITLWHEGSRPQEAVLALLNSTWFKCYMECISTVMGGGALKIEASHVRKVLFPVYSQTQIQALAAIGETLRQSRELTPMLQAELDLLAFAPFGPQGRSVLRKLKGLLNRLLSERGTSL